MVQSIFYWQCPSRKHAINTLLWVCTLKGIADIFRHQRLILHTTVSKVWEEEKLSNKAIYYSQRIVTWHSVEMGDVTVQDTVPNLKLTLLWSWDSRPGFSCITKSYIRVRPFKMETLRSVIRFVKPGKYLRIAFQGDLPFGLTTAPMVWTKVLAPIMEILNL